MKACNQCKDFLVCFAKKKNELLKYTISIKNEQVVDKMNVCKDFKSKERKDV